MVFISILTLISAKALPVLNTNISSIHFTRITSIAFLYTSFITIFSLNLQGIGSGIGIFSGLFQITQLGQILEIFIFLIGGLILMSWPQIKQKVQNIDILPQLAGSQPLSFPFAPSFSFYSDFENKNKKIAKTRGSSGPVGRQELTDKYSKDYSIIVLFSSLGSSLLISSFDLISLYLSIELQSFGLYVLSSLYRDSESSTSAGLKYFLLGGLSSCLILLGAGLIYSYTGTTNFESLYILNSISDINQQYIIQGISLGLILIFVGFLIKIAAAPLHNWSPDVYDGTPTIVTTWLTIVPKIPILILLLELQTQIGIVGGIKTIIISNTGYINSIENLTTVSELLVFLDKIKININLTLFSSILGFPVLKTLIIISSILSLIIGSLLGLAQVRIKRLLAYSTISHIGFILLALAINTEQSIDSFIFYILQYTITNLNVFLIILGLTYIINNKIETFTNLQKSINKTSNLNLERITTSLASSPIGQSVLSFEMKETKVKDIRYISELKGLFFSYPLLSLSLGVSLFSMAGIPPLIGFFSKQFVLYSALQNGYYFISILAIIVSVISASYYLKIIKVLFTESEIDSDSESETSMGKRESFNTSTISDSESNSGYLESTTSYHRLGIMPMGGSFGEQREAEILITNTHSYLISTLTLSILLFFIKPSIILNSTQLLSLSLFYI